MRSRLAAALLAVPLLGAAADDREPPEFGAASETFADASACRSHLARVVAEARAAGLDAAEGPYEFGPGDVRAHSVSAEGFGHRIAEYRCEEARLSTRTWARSMAGVEEEFTIESVARSAPWLQDVAGEQQ